MKYAYLTISLCLMLFGFAPSAHATAYYVSFEAGIVNGNGLATTTPFNNLDSFTESARSAGDIAFVRRGMASTTNVSDLNFTSDGSSASPIIISADYDNLWNDFATSTQTYSVAVATSTFYASANVTGITAGDWVYVQGDCTETYNSTSLSKCEFAYEVAAVSGTALRFYLPYKGNQTGSGLYLRVMPDNPQWNIAGGDFQWNFDSDNYWVVKGMDVRGTDVNGVVELDTSYGISFLDMIFWSNTASSGDSGIQNTDQSTSIYVSKCRATDMLALFEGDAASFLVGNADVFIDQCYLNNVAHITQSFFADTVFVSNSYMNGTSALRLGANNTVGLTHAKLRNTSMPTSTEIFLNNVNNPFADVRVEDYKGTVGDNRYLQMAQAFFSGGVDQATILSTSTLRSGGGSSSILVNPNTGISSINPIRHLRLFEYPIYTDTSSKQYDIYFRVATSTTEWTTDPTASELWIQCEYWSHNTGATSTRKIKKSTGVLDFNGSTAWQALSVTCQPTQSGIMYLSGYYGKAKETSQSNQFLVDSTPVVQ